MNKLIFKKENCDVMWKTVKKSLLLWNKINIKNCTIFQNKKTNKKFTKNKQNNLYILNQIILNCMGMFLSEKIAGVLID